MIPYTKSLTGVANIPSTSNLTSTCHNLSNKRSNANEEGISKFMSSSKFCSTENDSDFILGGSGIATSRLKELDPEEKPLLQAESDEFEGSLRTMLFEDEGTEMEMDNGFDDDDNDEVDDPFEIPQSFSVSTRTPNEANNGIISSRNLARNFFRRSSAYY